MDLVVRKQTYSKDDVPLFYCGVKNFSPGTILNTVNVAQFVPPNNPDFNTYEKIYPTEDGEGTYLLPKRYRGLASGALLVTDKSTNSKYQEYALPLYYEYELMYDHYSYDTTFPKGFITLRKNQETTVSEDSFVVETRVSAVTSGRYLPELVGWDAWESNPISGNIATCRLLLPARESDNSFYTVEYNRYANSTITEYWSELVDERELYVDGTDYHITPSSVTIPYLGSKMASGDPIFVQKNPNSYVELRYPTFTSDTYKTKSWEFSVKLGSFFAASGVYNDDGISYLANTDTTLTSMPSSDEIPVVVGRNVCRVSHRPLVTPSSTYPRPGYVFTDVVTDLRVNSENKKSGVTSVDARRGFIMLDRNLNATDNITVSYNSDPQQTLIIRNVDLNPLLNSAGVIDVAASGLGVAVVPSGTLFYDTGGTSRSWSNVALYSLVDNQYGDFTSGVFGYGASAYRASDLGANLVSGIIPSGSYFLGSITTCVSPEQNLDIVDVRRISGYDEDQLRLTTSGWRDYSDVGFWDGESLPMANVVIVQIPGFIYENIRGVFREDTNLAVPAQTQYPADLLMAIDRDSTENFSREQLVQRAANKYIQDTIERYLPVGVQYIIVDEEMREWPSNRREI